MKTFDDRELLNSQQREFLNCRRLPARLLIEQAATLLGFSCAETALLVGFGLLKPLGRPSANSVKHFSLATIERFSRDEDWLSRATAALGKRTKEKNRLTQMNHRVPRSVAA